MQAVRDSEKKKGEKWCGTRRHRLFCLAACEARCYKDEMTKEKGSQSCSWLVATVCCQCQVSGTNATKRGREEVVVSARDRLLLSLEGRSGRAVPGG